VQRVVRDFAMNALSVKVNGIVLGLRKGLVNGSGFYVEFFYLSLSIGLVK
jgi:hypothetical protein